jgi:SAM-dependent methyltransferase/predicted RNA-binding Zn-ribbon protein involved in translation (DUF1610 family)
MKALLRDLFWAPMQRHRRLAQASKLARRDATRFICPVCGYRGIFVAAPGPLGSRKYGRCPQCGAFERHRLQARVIQMLLPAFKPAARSALHFAPETTMKRFLSESFGQYKTSDLSDWDVDIRGDMRDMPVPDESFDFIFASHVLEHIPDDRRAIAELYRLLKPNGMAVLPVPIVGDKTIEYPVAVASENGHVRGPGPDYFDRYREVFDEVKVYTSADFPDEGQLYIYEDRTNVPNGNTPYRRPMAGERHLDYVPVCFKKGAPTAP